MAVPEVKYTPAPDEALPAMVHKDGMTLQVKGRAAQLKHPLNAHTDGDTYVYFADANVLATGDTVAIGRYPNIDFANGGTLKGMIAASDAYLVLSNDTTKIVPGHARGIDDIAWQIPFTGDCFSKFTCGRIQRAPRRRLDWFPIEQNRTALADMRGFVEPLAQIRPPPAPRRFHRVDRLVFE